MEPNDWTKKREERQERLRELAERVYQDLEVLLPTLTPGAVPDDKAIHRFRNRLKVLYDTVRIYLVLRVRERNEQ